MASIEATSHLYIISPTFLCSLLIFTTCCFIAIVCKKNVEQIQNHFSFSSWSDNPLISDQNGSLRLEVGINRSISFLFRTNSPDRIFPKRHTPGATNTPLLKFLFNDGLDGWRWNVESGIRYSTSCKATMWRPSYIWEAWCISSSVQYIGVSSSDNTSSKWTRGGCWFKLQHLGCLWVWPNFTTSWPRFRGSQLRSNHSVI